MVGSFRGAAGLFGNCDMPGLASAAPSVVIQTDPEHVMAAAALIRNTFVRPEDRKPLDFKKEESRKSARVSVNVPVQIASVVMSEGNAQVLDGETFGEVVDLSLRGLSLTHPDLFMHYFCLVTISLPTSETVSLLVEILWTVRETKEQFRSGGRFVGVIESAP